MAGGQRPPISARRRSDTADGFKSFALRHPGFYHLVGSCAGSDRRNPRETTMAGSLGMVSRTEPRTYTYLELSSASKRHAVIDRASRYRRRLHQGATPESQSGT